MLAELVNRTRKVLVHVQPTSLQEKEITDKEKKCLTAYRITKGGSL